MKSKRQVPFSQHSLIKSKKTKIIFGQHQIIVNNEADIAISDSNGNDELFSFEILFDHYEKQEPLHQKFNQEVISGTQLWKTQKSLIESVNSIASFRRDVKITNCDEKEDSLEDVTPFGQVHTKELNKFLDSGLSITLFNLDKYFECVREFVRYFDQKWKGEGGCYSSFHVTPRGKMPFPPFVDGDDKIIFQLQGSQNVKLFPPVNYDVQTELETFLYYEFPTSQPTIVHALLPFLQAKPILDIQLSPGDYLYVPKDYVLMTKASKQGSSFDVVIHLSKLKSTADLLKILTNKCSQKVYPHQQNNPFGKVVHETTQILQRGLDELPRIEKILQQRISLTRQDFNVFSSLDSYNLEELLEQNGGFVRLPNFLPIEVADKIHQTLVNMFDDEWVATESKADLSSNNIAHKFYSSKSFPNSDAIFNIFRHLIPFKESTFSAAKYSTSHHIDPHDDRAYKEIAGNIYSRYVAVIYYLTKDWKPEDGGGLVDVENNRQVYVPQYNSVVAFKVPRWHQVLPVLATDKQRLSIFGWFLVPGKLYKLNTGKHGAQY